LKNANTVGGSWHFLQVLAECIALVDLVVNAKVRKENMHVD